MSMEKQNPILAVPHDPSIQFVLSDLSATPTGSPNTSRTQAEERTKSIDARLKRKWKRQVEKERAYERTKAEKAKEESSDPNNSSSFIEVRSAVVYWRENIKHARDCQSHNSYSALVSVNTGFASSLYR
jgi:hypothetical protein